MCGRWISRRTFTCLLALTSFSTVVAQRCGNERCTNGSACTTTRGEAGSCIAVHSCRYMVRLVSSLRRPVSSRDRQLLRRDICAFQDSQALICCVEEAAPDLILDDSEPPAINRNNTTKLTPFIHSTTTHPTLPNALRPESPEKPIRFAANPSRTQSPVRKHVPPSRENVLRPPPPQKPMMSTVPVEQTTDSILNVVESSPFKEFLGELSTKECGLYLQDRIVGGNKTLIDHSPWLALLEYKTGRGLAFRCTGTLISNRFVLTAAHCVNGRELPTDWQLYSVRLGEYDLSTETDCLETDCNYPPSDVRVQSVIVHPRFNRTNTNQHHDIALIRLERAVDFTDFIRPICLPLSKELRTRNYTGIPMEIAGWGRTENSFTSTVKMSTLVPVTSSERCHEVYQGVGLTILDSQMCAGGEGDRDSCQGDSGGPLVSLQADNNQDNWYVIGVVSLGTARCGTEGWPGVYTKVSHYLGWIINIMLQEHSMKK